MPLSIKVDEDLPEEVASIFSAIGYETVTVRAQGWSGMVDEDLWMRVQAEGRWLITADLEFGDIRRYVPGSYVGIVLIRAETESRRRYLDLAAHAARSLRLEDAPRSLVVVTPRGIRIRDKS